MRIRQVSAEDVEAWDGFVRSRADASPFHLHGWGQAIHEAYGHSQHRLLAEADNGEILGILPLCRFRAPFGSKRFVSMPFCDLGGPVAVRDDVAAALVEQARGDAAADSVASVQVRGANPTGRPLQAFPVAEDKVRMVLRLPESSEALLASFKSKLRSQVNKAAKNGMTFDWVGVDSLHEFYEIFSRNMRDLGSPVHSQQLFRSVLNRMGESARVGVVRHEGTTVAAGFVLALGKHRLSIPWASSLRSHNRLAPNMWLYWNLLRYAADEGFAEFDFGRSTEGEGTYRFKAQWGAEPQPLGWWEIGAGEVRKGEPAQPESGGPGKVRSLAEFVWRKLPVPVANILGPSLRRYIDL